jgi:hypothetical protein
MHEIRKEKRIPEKLQVLISHMAKSLLTEVASTENVSPHGMRVLTEWPWPRDTQLILQSSKNELWARAKVVYCQTLLVNTFALGLEFVARTDAWIMWSSAFRVRPSTPLTPPAETGRTG